MDKGCKTCALDGILAYQNVCKNCVESGTFSGYAEKTCETCAYLDRDSDKQPCRSCDDASEWEQAKDEPKPDTVNHPAHYTECSLECIDVMLAVFGRRAVTDFCTLNAFKYMWRYEHKNGLEDLQKAEHYLAMATTFQTGDTEHKIRIIYMQEELEILMRRANK